MSEPNDHWLARGSTIKWLSIVSAIVLIALVISDVLIERHPHFRLDGVFGFNAWYGFLSCAVLIVLAKALGVLFKRPDDYYDS
jgi:hypothetical protein